MSVGINVVPHFIKARNEMELMKKMAMNTASRGTYIKYHSIQQLKNSEWVAWFDAEIKLNLKKDVKNDIPKE